MDKVWVGMEGLSCQGLPTDHLLDPLRKLQRRHSTGGTWLRMR